MPYRAQTISVRLIERHMTYCRMLAKMLIEKCQGKDAEAKAELEKLWDTFDILEYDNYSYIFSEQYYINFLLNILATFAKSISSLIKIQLLTL